MTTATSFAKPAADTTTDAFAFFDATRRSRDSI
jgi:hypothetical protein